MTRRIGCWALALVLLASAACVEGGSEGDARAPQGDGGQAADLTPGAADRGPLGQCGLWANWRQQTDPMTFCSFTCDKLEVSCVVSVKSPDPVCSCSEGLNDIIIQPGGSGSGGGTSHICPGTFAEDAASCGQAFAGGCCDGFAP